MHNLGYIISNYGLYLYVEKEEKTFFRWTKGTVISFSFLIGMGNMIVSLVLKEIMIAVMNLLIYIGMFVQFFKMEKEWRKELYTIAPGIIEAFMIFFTLLIIAFLFMKNKEISNIGI